MRHPTPKWLVPFLLTLLLLAMSAAANAEPIRATLIGYQEVPAVNTVATGHFNATINPGDQSIDYELSYSGLQATVQQAHIHVAQRRVNGSIVIWLCQTPAGTPPFTDPTHLSPTCPQSGTVTGTITSANVIAGSMTPQQLTAGDLADVIKAIRAGVAYANVHTSVSPGGEIRGQIRALHRDGDDDDRD
jgi:CHRD domain